MNRGENLDIYLFICYVLCLCCHSNLEGNPTTLRADRTTERDLHDPVTQPGSRLSTSSQGNGTSNGTLSDLDVIIADLSKPWNPNATRRALIRSVQYITPPAATAMRFQVDSVTWGKFQYTQHDFRPKNQ